MNDPSGCEAGEGKGKGPLTGLVSSDSVAGSSVRIEELLLLDPDALRGRARRILHNASSFAGFRQAENVLIVALQKDLIDVNGETRYLLALACFHQQNWAGAEMHLNASLLKHPLAKHLLERVQINLKTGVERSNDQSRDFNAEELRRPAALSIRAPDIREPLPPEEKEGLLMRLLHGGWSKGAGALAEGAISLAYRLRDTKSVFAFESWDRRGLFRGVLELGGMRRDLNGDKLQSTYNDTLVGDQPPGQRRPEWTERFRTATGAWTTDDPMEGAAGTQIQRSGSPLASRKSRADDGKLPSPRAVSRYILAPLAGRPRQEAPFLNLLAIAWIQAQLHDWVSHRPTPFDGVYKVPLEQDDPLRERYGICALQVQKSANNPMPGARPLTHLSEVTHWWDASHIYGSDQDTQDRLRTGADGRFLPGGELRIEGDLLPLREDPLHRGKGIEDTGFSRNWWVGLDIIHTLFVKHHNFICGELRKKHADWTSDPLFHTARLINTAIMAKIHTVEWTPAALPNRKVVSGMATNWWGLLEALFKRVSERSVKSDWEPRHHVVGGIVGGKRDNYGKPFGMTEEFTEVYRLHAGIPDEIRLLQAKPVPMDATRGDAARVLVQTFGMASLLNSFGHQHMPALVNNNYPAFMSEMSVPGQPVIDIGTIDIFRARERGVPPYNDFRRMLGLNPISRFEDLGCGAETVETLERLYGKGNKGVDKMDLLAGTSCELWWPENFGFGETMFTIFIQMASRRLHADPFYTEKFNARYYTMTGMDLIEAATFKGVLLQHYPELENHGLGNVQNAFEPWGTTAATHPEQHPLAQIVRY